MGEVIWLERLSRNGEVLARHRHEHLPLTVGRGYAADLIVDDPAVAALHLRIARDDSGALLAEDLGSLNGLLMADGKPAPQGRMRLQADTVLRIGDTCLRVRDADTAVAPERKLSVSQQSKAATAIALGLLLAGLAMLEQWLGQTGEPSVGRYLSIAGLALIGSAIWAGAWALVNRLFAGSMEFARHLALTYAALMTLILVDASVDAGSYLLSSSVLQPYGFVTAWLVTGALCLGHLRQLSPNRPGLKLAAIGGLTALGLGWGTLQRVEQRELTGPATVVNQLLPPSLALAAPASLDEFMARDQALRADIDRARKDPPTDSQD